MNRREADERDCARLREVGAEFVLGTLDGHERADAVEHLARCARCRDEISSMSGAVADMALLAPRVPPSPGFTNRVLAAMDVESARPPASAPVVPIGLRRRSWRRPLVAIIAAAAVLVLAVGGVIVARQSTSETSVAMSATAMVATDGEIIGTSNLVDGAAGTVHVEVTYPSNWLDYRLEAIDASGMAVPLGKMHLVRGSWQWTGPLPTGKLTALRIVRPDGIITCQGSVPT